MNELKTLLESGIEANIEKALSLAKEQGVLDTIIQPYLELNQWLQQFGRGVDEEASVEEMIHYIVVVEYLDITDKKLEKLPENIFYLMRGLITINLSNNKLSSLPDSIATLKNVRSLALTYNNLIQLNEQIGALQSLEALYLSDNKINKLPDSIGDLKALEELYLTRNPLLKLPATIHKMTSLVHLDIEDNMDDDYNIVSDEEQDRIQQSLPNCEVRF
ncbi:MAG: leucine-rich repeat domain-containing protein [Aureispira sp.]